MPSTDKFEWDVNDFIGRGAYGRVYKVSITYEMNSATQFSNER